MLCYSQLILKTMDIIVRTDDKIRLQNWNAKVFADVNSNSEQFGIDNIFNIYWLDSGLYQPG